MYLLSDSTRAVYVSIGGDISHQFPGFGDKYAGVLDQVVLQDLAHRIVKALSIPGAEDYV